MPSEVDDEDFEESFEPSTCEECWTPTERLCDRCARRICRKCATDHHVEPILYEEYPPPKCVPLTGIQKASLEQLPKTRENVQREGHRVRSYRKLVQIGYAVWEDDVLRRRYPGELLSKGQDSIIRSQ